MRPLVRYALAVGLVTALTTCSEGPSGPRLVQADLALAVRFEGERSAQAASAFDKADRLVIRVTPQGGVQVVETCLIEEPQQTIECAIEDVDLPEGQHQAAVSAALQLGPDPVFSGQQTVELSPGRLNQVELTLAAVPHHITPASSSVQLINIGEQAQLGAAVAFVTGDEIPGQPISWSTGAGGIDLTPGGLVTARSNGTWQVTASSGALSATVNVVVAAVATVTSVSPSTVTAGQQVVLQITGTNLHGATGVGVCGWAAVSNGSLTVTSDGTLVTVPVVWPAYAPDGTSQAGPTCMIVGTPQGTGTGSVGLNVIAPPPAPTLISYVDQSGTWLAMFDPGTSVRVLGGPYGGVDNPRLSPGGAYVTFGMTPDGSPAGLDVLELDVSSGAVTPLITTPFQDTHFVSDPSGSMGIFRRCDGGGCWLWDWVGGVETNRGVDGCNPLDPEYRAAGQLLYSSEYEVGTGLCNARRIQRWSSPEPITLAGGDPAYWPGIPRLSPDGSMIAYTVRELSSGATDLYTMNSDGSGQTMRHQGVGWISWATPGWILFTNGGLNALDLATGEVYWLLSLGASIAHVDRR